MRAPLTSLKAPFLMSCKSNWLVALFFPNVLRSFYQLWLIESINYGFYGVVLVICISLILTAFFLLYFEFICLIFCLNLFYTFVNAVVRPCQRAGLAQFHFNSNLT